MAFTFIYKLAFFIFVFRKVYYCINILVSLYKNRFNSLYYRQQCVEICSKLVFAVRSLNNYKNCCRGLSGVFVFLLVDWRVNPRIMPESSGIEYIYIFVKKFLLMII